MKQHNTAGIDVGKSKLDLAIAGPVATLLTVANDPAGWQQISAALRRAGVSRVGLEASGGYERDLVAHLRRAGVTVLLLQPIQVRAFAQSKLQRAKNDRLDAQLIAAFTALCEAPARTPDPRLAPLAEGLVFLEQVEDDLVRAKTRLEHTRAPRLRRMIQADIARATKRRAAELARLLAGLRAEPDLAQRLDLVLSIPGIGERTAVTLLIAMPELGALSREAAAALAGLCPYDRDSGASHGERRIAGGRARVRTALYAAAVAASTRWNPALVALYARLRLRGKKPKQAFIACARKLLIFANTVLARGTPWRSQTAS